MNGMYEIKRERNRQVHTEGWTCEHDDTHTKGELSRAAFVYANVCPENLIAILEGRDPEYVFPWDLEWFKPYTRDDYEFPAVDERRCLVKAGALALAEIERMERFIKEVAVEIDNRTDTGDTE